MPEETPRATVYGLTNCQKCLAAVEKLDLLGIPSEKQEINQFLLLHDGWEDDGSVEISSAYYMHGQQLPIIKLGDEFFDYPGAMRRAKEIAGVRPA